MNHQDRSPEHARARRLAVTLVAMTMAYNVAEAIIALSAGVAAESIALFGFGLDSIIECLAAGVLLWRLAVENRGATLARVEAAERRAARIIGGTFVALAVYVSLQSGLTLISRRPPHASLVGIILASASLLIMPLLSWWKLTVAARIGSAALRAEAKETLACAYLSLTLLAGLGANAVAGWWWADPVAAILMVPWLLKEGAEGLRGECRCREENDACACDDGDSLPGAGGRR